MRIDPETIAIHGLSKTNHRDSEMARIDTSSRHDHHHLLLTTQGYLDLRDLADLPSLPSGEQL